MRNLPIFALLAILIGIPFVDFTPVVREKTEAPARTVRALDTISVPQG